MIFAIIIEFNQFRQKYAVQKEIDSLSAQAQSLQKNNNDLQSFIAYLKTDEYKQKAAREQLNMKKDGEVVYSFAKPAASTQVSANTPSGETSMADANTNSSSSSQPSNLQKWWNYFFVHNE